LQHITLEYLLHYIISIISLDTSLWNIFIPFRWHNMADC